MKSFFSEAEMPSPSKCFRLNGSIYFPTGYGVPLFLPKEEATKQDFKQGGDSKTVLVAECFYREATEEEISRFLEDEAIKEEFKKRQEDIEKLSKIAKKIVREGDAPKEASPEGLKLHEKIGLRGDGDYFVLGSEHIWYVLNNGADGDDFERSNIRTNSGGAIGYAIPYKEEIAQEILTAKR